MKTKTAAKRAFGYVRCSHVLQAENGETLQVQEEQLRAICTLNGLQLAGVFVEAAVSGGTPFRGRPQGSALWAQLQPGDVIVSTKLDRAFRSTEDALAVLEACRKRGVGLILLDLGHQDLTDGAVAKLTLSLIASVANFERDRCGERIKAVKASQRDRGRFCGGSVPFGHVVVERDGERFLEVDTAMAERVRGLRAREYSVRGICVELGMETGARPCERAVRRFLAA